MGTNLFKSLLRIMTPEEIQELTSLPEVGHKSSLTDLICQKLEQEAIDGKIVDIPTFSALEDNDPPPPLTFKSDKKGVEFILEFKEKMLKGKKKLQKKRSINAYKENVAVDITESKEESGKEISSSIGILINKKRY